MIEVLAAEAALDAAGKGLTLICFARQEDTDASSRLLERFVKTHHFRIIRVEPSVENAQVIQVPRFPTFILYEDGTERFQAIGQEQLADSVRKFIR